MSYTEEDTIFVQIISYREHELQFTLKDLFEKAKRPKNIFVGICHQYDIKGDEDKHLFEIPFSHPEQLRIDEVDYREAKGCGWARNRVQQLYKNEKWTLILDAHHRFVENWDELLVKDIKQLIINTNNNKVAITASGIPYNINDVNLNTPTVFSLTVIFFNNNRIRFGFGSNLSNNSIFRPTIATCLHFFFAPASFTIDVKFDTKLFIAIDELSISSRVFTHGYNVFLSKRGIIYHLYKDGENSKHTNIQKTFNNNSGNNVRYNLSYERLDCLLNIKKTKNPDILNDIKKYSFGTKRTLRDYERFSGVDFRKYTIHERAKMGVFEKWQEVSKINNVKTIFSRVYRI